MVIDLIIQVVLSPVLLVQAMRTRATAMWLPEPPGDRSGVVGQGPVIRLLVLGDSAAAGVGAPTQDAAVAGCLIAQLAQTRTVEFDIVAQTGARTVDALAWLEDLPRDRYDYVLISLGVNDVTKVAWLPLWVARQERLVDLLRDRFKARLVLTTGLPPMGRFPLLPDPMRWVVGRRAHRFDAAVTRALEKCRGTARIPVDPVLDPTVMAEDGFHPGPKMHAEWARLAALQIAADLDADEATA